MSINLDIPDTIDDSQNVEGFKITKKGNYVIDDFYIYKNKDRFFLKESVRKNTKPETVENLVKNMKLESFYFEKQEKKKSSRDRVKVVFGKTTKLLPSLEPIELKFLNKPVFLQFKPRKFIFVKKGGIFKFIYLYLKDFQVNILRRLINENFYFYNQKATLGNIINEDNKENIIVIIIGKSIENAHIEDNVKMFKADEMQFLEFQGKVQFGVNLVVTKQSVSFMYKLICYNITSFERIDYKENKETIASSNEKSDNSLGDMEENEKDKIIEDDDDLPDEEDKDLPNENEEVKEEIKSVESNLPSKPNSTDVSEEKDDKKIVKNLDLNTSTENPQVQTKENKKGVKSPQKSETTPKGKGKAPKNEN